MTRSDRQASDLTVREWRDELLVADFAALRFVSPHIVGTRAKIIATFLRPFDYVLAPLGTGR